MKVLEQHGLQYKHSSYQKLYLYILCNHQQLWTSLSATKPEDNEIMREMRSAALFQTNGLPR